MSRRFISRLALQAAAGANGNGAHWDVSGLEFAVFQVLGITTATINFEATLDGSTWVAVLATNQTSGTAATTTAANGLFGVQCAGYAQMRARISGYSAGTIDVLGLGMGR